MTEPLNGKEANVGLSDSNAGLEGMTLIDHFAAIALPIVCAIPDAEWPFDFSDAYGDETCHADHVALGAYAYAEAMMRARNRISAL